MAKKKQGFAIVDIETTGSPIEKNGITEIAVLLHNGKEIESRYQTLINPGMPIPPYVSHLTHISNKMVAQAPTFEQIAPQLFEILKDRIFIAHNVAFDYPFIKHFFKNAGLDFNEDRLCTIKLSRCAFPGLDRYGLDYLCQEFGIDLGTQHRAGNDAFATTIIFDKILKHGGEKLVETLTETDQTQVTPTKIEEIIANKKKAPISRSKKTTKIPQNVQQ